MAESERAPRRRCGAASLCTSLLALGVFAFEATHNLHWHLDRAADLSHDHFHLGPHRHDEPDLPGRRPDPRRDERDGDKGAFFPLVLSISSPLCGSDLPSLADTVASPLQVRPEPAILRIALQGPSRPRAPPARISVGSS